MSFTYNRYENAVETLATARSKQAGKPIAHNTRLFERADGIAVRFHAVDVVTMHEDGTFTLRTGGWHTVTTLDRIRSHSPAHLLSERGEWYVRLAPNSADPRPTRVDRTVPKPYIASDPGPKPIKSEHGCQAGSLMGTDHIDEIVETWRKDMRDGDEIVEIKRESGSMPDYDRLLVKRSWTSWIFYGEDAHSYQSTEWRQADNKTDTVYEQCPHCAAFTELYEGWRMRMRGVRWGQRFDQQTGYGTYREMMNAHGSMEAWQEAYIADFRARRAYLAADKAWDERNRVLFFDGITVDSDGYAPRLRATGPSPAKLRRHEAKVAKVKKQIDKYVAGFIAELHKGTMPMPSGGDCWFCGMYRADGRPLGDAMDTLHGDGRMTIEEAHDHLWEHMKERYYVPSLAVNALRERGYKDVGIYMWLDMNQDTGTMGGIDGRYENVKRDLTKYLVKRLVPKAPTE